MNNMGAQAVLTVLLLTIGTVEAADGEGGVSFWRSEFTMTCPGDDALKWFRDGKEVTDHGSNKTYTLSYSGETKGVYYCQYDDDDVEHIYYFYVQGKACENCFELDAFLLGVAIFADLIFTVFVMMTIYRCTKKKIPPAPVPHSSNAAPRSGGRGPNAPSSSSPYESLAPQTRAEDTYSKIRVR
ncbi:T-cell surface glycoprotein CD3 epsilon chain-like isoform X2 [Scomber scombrus]|uniref:T-cell surface glycoprotein CD3 epsilon chain-like isoform X2 n=1 Tax=Scomber scombrus TaxID=13677 RepID=UPI002DDAAB4A|nr:T-cell surface glycoprotein CD3 epsilon chain-like isoform X2 [Scomber scombrus]